MGLAGELLQETYRVGDLLGTGGMGDVYAASHTRLNRRFAIKILHTRFAKNNEAYQRFRREAQITSELGHPHIVEVVDFNLMKDGSPYIVMEFLEGEDLEERLDRVGKVDITTAVHIARQLGSALAAAHAKQIVHRDLKPQNVFVMKFEDDDWYLKILDFGISKIRGSTSIVTQDKALLGTPNYMSPEQAEGKTDLVDHRTDQFALGTMIYEMLSGTNPFEAESIPSIMYHVVHTTPPPLNQVAAVPPAFAMAVSRAMSKDPEQRFPGIREFVRVLRGLPATMDTGPIRINPPATGVATTPGKRGAVATAQTVAQTGGMDTQSGAQSEPSSASVVPIRPGIATPAPTVGSGTSVDGDSLLEQPPRRKPIVYVAVGILGILAAVVSFMLVGGGSKDKAKQPVADTARGTQPPPGVNKPLADDPPVTKEIPRTVHVRFVVTPTPDKIIVDGEAIKGDRVELPQDDDKHTVRFEKAGYEAKEQTFNADERQTITVELNKLAAKRAVRKRVRKRTPTRRKTATRKRTTKKKKKTKKKSKFMLDLD